MLDEAELLKTLSEQLKLPLIDLRRTLPTEEALAALPESVVRATNALPMRVAGKGVAVAMAGPPTPEVLAELESRRRHARQRRARAGVRRPPPHRPLLPRHGGHGPHRRGVPGRRSRRAPTAVSPRAPRDQPHHRRRRAGRPGRQPIITQALRDRASDIHIEPQDDAAAGPLPHRRRAARRARPARRRWRRPLVSRIKIMAEHEHRRAAARRRTASSRSSRRPRRSTSASPPPRRSGARRSCCGSSTRAARCSS